MCEGRLHGNNLKDKDGFRHKKFGWWVSKQKNQWHTCIVCFCIYITIPKITLKAVVLRLSLSPVKQWTAVYTCMIIGNHHHKK